MCLLMCGLRFVILNAEQNCHDRKNWCNVAAAPGDEYNPLIPHSATQETTNIQEGICVLRQIMFLHHEYDCN